MITDFDFFQLPTRPLHSHKVLKYWAKKADVRVVMVCIYTPTHTLNPLWTLITISILVNCFISLSHSGIFMPPPWNGRGHVVLPFVILSFHNYWFQFIISGMVAHIELCRSKFEFGHYLIIFMRPYQKIGAYYYLLGL